MPINPRLLHPTGKFAGAVRLTMLEHGYALVETPTFLDDDLFLRLTRRKTVLQFHDKRWWKYPKLARYGCWLESLLGKALPEEEVALVYLEFRNEPAGTTDHVVDRMHVDGSYIRSVFTPYGEATIFRDEVSERSVPDGQTLLMTAVERSRVLNLPCTLHRRPGPGPERVVIVCAFEPRPEQPQLPSLYRRVAQSSNSYRASCA